MTAASVKEGEGYGSLVFEKNHMPEGVKKILLLLYSDTAGRVEAYWNNSRLAEWKGNTSSHERKLTPYELPSENTVIPEKWPALWIEAECPVDNTETLMPSGRMELRLYGDVKLLSVRFK